MERKKLGDMFRHLGMLLGSGVTLVESLKKCEKHSYIDGDAASLSAVREMVLQGRSFAESLSPIGVPEEFVDLIKAAEVSGDLDTVLIRIAELASPLARETGSVPAASSTVPSVEPPSTAPGAAMPSSGATEKIDRIISDAVSREASDVHLVPVLEGLLIRFRINGILSDIETVEKEMQSSMVARIKHMSCLDIAEKRLPQDGRIRVRLNGQAFDLRVCVVPSALGEKVTLRVISQEKVVIDLDKFKFSAEDLDKIRRMLARPWGLIFVTGPTGSGKTTTCYGMVNELAGKNLNVVTIEDPVEYLIRGTTQIQVRPELDLTFKAATLSALKCDPDAIFIGEMRDAGILDLALRAAQTGHLVIAQMHCRDLLELVEMLVNLEGIDKAVLANTINGMISQNLLRKLCHCKNEVDLSMDASAARMPDWGWRPPDRVFVSVGCPDCLESGYKGRIPVNQVFEADHAFKSALARVVFIKSAERKNSECAAALIGGTLLAKALQLVREGVTSIEEVRRVFGTL